jgi:hypothetical protein
VFQTFFRELKEEVSSQGEEMELGEDEARELFKMTEEEFFATTKNSVVTTGASPDEYDWDKTEVESDLEDEIETVDATDGEEKQEDEASGFTDIAVTKTDSSQEGASVNDITIFDKMSPEEKQDITDLQEVLPGMPITRLRKIRKTFKSSLQSPSMLSLVPLLREKMPDIVSSGWLKQTNIQNADFVLDHLRKEGELDVPILNTALQVQANAGNIDKVLEIYQQEFKDVEPTEYTDRLVIQTLLENKRISRALAFKDTLEQKGRSLDLRAFGSLVEYYGRHGHVGSALMLLQECVDRHGSSPSEHYLKDLRVLCRRNNLEHDPQIKALMGEDPNRWLKHGERFLKRDKTKKGRRDVNLASI